MNYLLTIGVFPGIQHSQTRKRGSIVGKKSNKLRDFGGALRRILEDYFTEPRKYDEKDFERRFCLPLAVFRRVYAAINRKGIFVERVDATG